MGGVIELRWMYVEASHRRRGVGRQLMEYAVSRAKGENCCRIGLSSDKSRQEAHQFYHAIGFEASAHGFRMYF